MTINNNDRWPPPTSMMAGHNCSLLTTLPPWPLSTAQPPCKHEHCSLLTTPNHDHRHQQTTPAWPWSSPAWHRWWQQQPATTTTACQHQSSNHPSLTITTNDNWPPLLLLTTSPPPHVNDGPTTWLPPSLSRRQWLHHPTLSMMLFALQSCRLLKIVTHVSLSIHAQSDAVIDTPFSVLSYWHVNNVGAFHRALEHTEESSSLSSHDMHGGQTYIPQLTSVGDINVIHDGATIHGCIVVQLYPTVRYNETFWFWFCVHDVGNKKVETLMSRSWMECTECDDTQWSEWKARSCHVRRRICSRCKSSDGNGGSISYLNLVPTVALPIRAWNREYGGEGAGEWEESRTTNPISLWIGWATPLRIGLVRWHG